MPIRPELRHFYRGPAWIAARKRILARAGNKCERCLKPNGVEVWTATGRDCLNEPVMIWSTVWGADGWHNQRGKDVRQGHALLRAPHRIITVVLTIAHLNHQPGDNRTRNLKALCQWCHLMFDREHHHITRATRKDARRPIQWEAAIAL